MSHPYQSYLEITQQRTAWQASVTAVCDALERVKVFFAEAKPSAILFTGCTSPYYVGESVAPYWQAKTGLPVRAVPCSELTQFPAAYYTSLSGEPVLVVISRSGKTSETLWAAEAFLRRYPGRALAICCAPDSPLARMVKPAIFLPEGFEQTLAQTSSFSSMLLAAQMIGAAVCNDEARLQTLSSAPPACDRVLSQAEPVVQAIFGHKPYQNIFFLGAGPTFGIARDAQLKMMEMSLSDTLCYTFMESRHGPRSLITEDSLVVGLCTHGGLGLEANLLAEYTHQLGATTVAITPSRDWPAGNPTVTIPVGCDWPDDLIGLLYAPVIQLLAYYRAVAKDVNPDVSRNLTQHIAVEPVAG